MKRNRKWKILHTVLERQTLCFSSYKNRKLKVKPWWVGAHEGKKKAFFVPFILSEGNSFKICVLSWCIVYWIYFQNIHTFSYQKKLHHTLLLFVSKIVCIFKLLSRKVMRECDNWKPNFLPRLMFNWRTFSRRVKARWWHQRAKNQGLTNQNSRNRWCQILRQTIWRYPSLRDPLSNPTSY